MCFATAWSFHLDVNDVLPSLRVRRSIFPEADFGISFMNSTPPANCLNGATCRPISKKKQSNFVYIIVNQIGIT